MPKSRLLAGCELDCLSPGIALGVDRWVMLFAGLENIREVIAFPKTQKATDLMTEAPGSVDDEQLVELHVSTIKPKA